MVPVGGKKAGGSIRKHSQGACWIWDFDTVTYWGGGNWNEGSWELLQRKGQTQLKEGLRGGESKGNQDSDAFCMYLYTQNPNRKKRKRTFHVKEGTNLKQTGQ